MFQHRSPALLNGAVFTSKWGAFWAHSSGLRCCSTQLEKDHHIPSFCLPFQGSEAFHTHLVLGGPPGFTRLHPWVWEQWSSSSVLMDPWRLREVHSMAGQSRV